MIEKIRLLLEYGTYPLWLYDENGLVIDNDNPPEWKDDRKLTSAFMELSDYYDSFFINNEKVFEYKGIQNKEDSDRLRTLYITAKKILLEKNRGKYLIQDDITEEDLTGHTP